MRAARDFCLTDDRGTFYENRGSRTHAHSVIEGHTIFGPSVPFTAFTLTVFGDGWAYDLPLAGN